MGGVGRKQTRRDRGTMEDRWEKVRKKPGVFPVSCESVRATDYHATMNGRTKPIETRDKQIRRSCIERYVVGSAHRARANFSRRTYVGTIRV